MIDNLTLTALWPALLGGLLIGASVTLVLVFNGRVTGISGIVNGVLSFGAERANQGAFLGGLLAGGLILQSLAPQVFANTSGRSLGMIGVAGLLVGFGTLMGNGCTSGHGICGLSRLSVRSIVATLAFMAAGFITVSILHVWGQS